MWQRIAVYTIVALAMALAIFRILRKQKARGKCSNCSSNPKAKGKSMEENQIKLKVQNMHCENCENTVIRALQTIDGIGIVTASHADGTVTITYRGLGGGASVEEAARQKLEFIGFPPVP